MTNARAVWWALLVLLAAHPGTPAAAQATSQRTPWSVGATVGLSQGHVPIWVVEDPCGARRSYLLGATSSWMPFEGARWLGLENELLLTVPLVDSCETAPRPPEGERLVIESELTGPWVSLGSRLILELPYEPFAPRFHLGAAGLMPGARPAMNTGVGLYLREGPVAVTLGWDWWAVWPGGDRYFEEWDETGTRRQHLGAFDERFTMRMTRISVRWEVAGERR